MYASPWGQYDNFGRSALEASPDAAYSKWLDALGLGIQNPGMQRQYGQGMYGDFQQDYFTEAAKPNQQGLKWLDYLDKLGSTGAGPMDVFGQLSAKQQGTRGVRPTYVGF